MRSFKATSRPVRKNALRSGQTEKDVVPDLTLMPEIISHDIANGVVLSLKTRLSRQA